MYFVSIALKQFGTKIPWFLIGPFIATVFYHIAQGNDPIEAVKKSL